MSRRIVVPPVVALTIVALYLVAESFGFRGFAAAEATTVSEAAAMGHAARALELIADGQNPNQRQHVAARMLDSMEHDMMPLEAAILGRHLEMARLLLRSGAAHFDTRRAVCFARARLPEILPELNAEPPSSGSVAEIGAAIESCVHRD